MKQKKIKTSFIIRFVIILTSIAFLTFSILFSIDSLQNAKDYNQNINSVISTLYVSEVGHYKFVINLQEAIDGEAEFTGSADATQCLLGKHIYSADVQNNPDVAGLLSQIEPLHKEIHTLAQDVVNLLDSNSTAAKQSYKNDVRPKIDNLVDILDSAITARQTMIVDSDNALNDVLLRCIIMVSIAVAISVAACVNLFLYVKNHIGEPILYISKMSHKLSEGQLGLDFTVGSNNEVGDLGKVLGNSVKEIYTYVLDIDRTMEQFAVGNFDVVPSQPFIGDFQNIERSITDFIVNMSKTMRIITQSAEVVSVGSEQVSDAACSMAQGSTEQASAVEELSASIAEISSQIKDTAGNAEVVSKLVGETGNSVMVCNAQMTEMVSAIGNVSGKSNEIGKIIKTIEDIAFQTNILALNAAVEAARAGTAGKGFAVVADEVRNLAGKSAAAAKNTTDLIQETIFAVANGERLAQLTASTLEGIVVGAQEITTRVQDISKSVREQSEAASQVTIGIEQISGVIQGNSAIAEQSAAASEEMSSQAQVLNNLVGKFVLKPDNIT